MPEQLSDVALGKYMTAVPVVMPNWVTRKWLIHTRSGGLLGIIRWYGAWRAYIFEPSDDTVFSADCLQELAWFLQHQNEEHRKHA